MFRFNNIKGILSDSFYRCRKTSLLIAVIAGFILMGYFTHVSPFLYEEFLGEIGQAKGRLTASFMILLLSSPVLWVLWLYRTHDTLEATNRRSLFDSLKMIGSDSGQNKGFGFRQLMYLRNQVKVYKSEIDTLMQGMNLDKAILYRVDLRETKLNQVSFIDAYLRQAQLQNVILEKANLIRANLTDSNLIGANLQDTDLRGAKYSASTVFPDGFDPQGKDMKMVATEKI